MPRYIDVEVLISKSVNAGNLHPGVPVVPIGEINIAPTVADIPAPVKCGECISYCAGFCTRDIGARTNMFRMPPNGFCSYGERKDGSE